MNTKITLADDDNSDSHRYSDRGGGTGRGDMLFVMSSVAMHSFQCCNCALAIVMAVMKQECTKRKANVTSARTQHPAWPY
jgi:hypothetical protein